MKTLFVAWQSPDKSRAWFPIGRLEADNGQYRFCYTHGAEEAERAAGFQPMPAFPDFFKSYESSTLFPLFQNRIMQPNRPDFPEYLQWLDMSKENFDPLEVLALTGGARQTDRLEIFPKLHADASRLFRARFFLHGMRHTNEHAIERAETLLAGEKLHVAIEVTNPATSLAVQLLTTDYYMLGWAPRYLVEDLVGVLENHREVNAKVVKNNHHETPMNCKTLVEVSGTLPEGNSPMSSLRFQPLCAP